MSLFVMQNENDINLSQNQQMSSTSQKRRKSSNNMFDSEPLKSKREDDDESFECETGCAHHCVNCRQLSVSTYGDVCYECGQFYDNNCLDKFFILCICKGANEQIEEEDGSLCPICFIRLPQYWCQKLRCHCNQRIHIVFKNAQKMHNWQQRLFTIQ